VFLPLLLHRIDTILDCDHLLVLSNGSLVEQGSPTQLSTGDGTFAGMVSAAKAAASKHHH
jgi:ABC-type multidrug transport system fused ATPase/permease subunit